MRPDSMQERLRLANNSDKHKGNRRLGIRKVTAFGEYGLKSRPEHTDRAFGRKRVRSTAHFRKNGLN